MSTISNYGSLVGSIGICLASSSFYVGIFWGEDSILSTLVSSYFFVEISLSFSLIFLACASIFGFFFSPMIDSSVND